MENRRGLSRRSFTLAAAAMPGAIAASPGAAFAQAPVPAAPVHVPPVGGAAAIRALVEKLSGDPFARPIAFARNKQAPKLKPFALGEVRLGDGEFRQAHLANAGYMKRLPLDRLLHTFRLNAGIASTAEPLGGWEDPRGELRGHFIGHYLSACALGHASTGDAEFKQRGDAMVAELAQCQAKINEGGYLSAYPSEFYDRLGKGVTVWAPFYTMHKLMAGLIDMHTQAGNAQALVVVTGMAGWVDNWTAARSEDDMQKVLNVEFGGMNEALYNLADVTSDDRWAKVGDRFTKKVVFNPLAQSQDQLAGRHMNTHVPQIIGAARRYELSGDHRFHDVANFFWNTVTTSRTYATGGSSNRENWLSNPSRLSEEWAAAAAHQECCCSYNMMKLTRHLFGWNADARYIDYYERNLFNHRLGTIQTDTGMNTYFMSLAPGAWRVPGTETTTFWCCNGSAVEEFNKLSDTIYYNDGKNVWVNLFLDSALDWKERGIRLSQHTRFPHEARTRLVIEQAPAGVWALNLRIPSWTSETARVLVNGKPLEGTAPGSYLRIARKWKKGDEVVLEMPMTLRTEGFADDPSLQAVLVGPIVLAGQFPKGELPAEPVEKPHGPNVAGAPFDAPVLAVAGKPAEGWLVPSGEPLTYRTTGLGQDITLKPVNQSWDRYVVYWKTA